MSKLIVIGIDGATFSLLEPWAKSGKLPNFKKLLDGGVYGQLKSPLPPCTLSAWPAILTGKSPGKLGVLEFWQVNRSNYEAELTPILWDKWNPLWRILDRHGKKVCICNVPTAYAPDNGFSGVFISGPQSQGGEMRRSAFPPMLENTLKQINFQIYAPSITAVGKEKFPQHVFELTDTKMKIASILLSQNSWDFFMFGLFYADQIQHFYWKYTDESHPDYQPNNKYSNVILDYYRMVDNWLDSLFSFNTNIMIVSDHGQGKMLRYVNFNAWLMSKNLLALTAEGGERLGQDDTITTMKINGQSYYAKIKPMITASDIDWNRTKAYSANNASININLQGREVQGCVKEGEEYHNIRTYLKEELLKVKDTNGQCIVEEVFSREDLYEGEEVSKLPDIIFAYKNDSFYYNPSINVGYFPSQEIIYDEAPEYCFELERSAEHTRYGIFIAYGPDINEGEKIQGAENIDIAPTALHILRTPVPEDIEGKVLKEIFKKDSPLATFETLQEKIEKSDSPQTCQEYGYTEEEEKDIERRLRELGYL